MSPEDYGQTSSNWFDGSWVHTYTGRRFELFAPTVDMVDVRDIAHALSQQCRYNGHTPTHYSVAQHSVLASLHVCRMDYVNDRVNARDPVSGEALDMDPVMLRRWALLHDASEAYTGDLVRPLKQHPQLRAVYKPIEARIQAVVCAKFGLPVDEPTAVKVIDRRLCVTEKFDVLRQSLKNDDAGVERIHATIKPVCARDAEDMFLRRFQELFS